MQTIANDGERVRLSVLDHGGDPALGDGGPRGLGGDGYKRPRDCCSR